jgi:glycosyltransferase involved in cell wall biosynthesis
LTQVWGIAMVRDEADIIGYTLRHMISEGLDGIVIADNLSVDKTRSIIEEVAAETSIPIVVVTDDEVGYYQSRKMTYLAELAHDEGAEWIVPFDADELWFCSSEPVADVLRKINQFDIVEVELYNHFRTTVDIFNPNPYVMMAHRQDVPGFLPKVACRWKPDLVISMGNHDAIYNDNNPPRMPRILCRLSIRHFPYRSAEQFLTKAINGGRAYEASNLPDYYGAHWRKYYGIVQEEGSEVLLEQFWRKYFIIADLETEHLRPDPAPYLRWTSPPATN